MNSVAIQIAEAVKDELNGVPDGTFSQKLTAVRKTIPRWSLEDLKTLRVTVTPKSNVSQVQARNVVLCQYAVDVAVMQYAPPDAAGDVDQAPLDAMIGLAEEIEAFFELRRLEKYPDALWLKCEWNPAGAPWAVELLDTKNIIASVLTITFEVMRQKQ